MAATELLKEQTEFVDMYYVAEAPEDEEDLDALVARHQTKSSGFTFLLVSADWCSDCVKGSPRVLPALQAAAQKAKKHSTLLKLDVGTREQWRDPDHVYRRTPLLYTTNIPTLYHIGADGKVVNRLVESALYSPPDALEHFFNQAFSI